MIFIASPYGDDNDYWTIERNILRADAVARHIAVMGHEPVCPHNLSRHWELDKRLKREDFIRIDDALLKLCDAVFFIDSSPGADREVAIAKELGKPVFNTFRDILDYRKP